MSDDLGAYNIEDLRQIAKKRLPRPIFEYIDGAAEDGIAIQHNREVYRSLKIKNRVLKDVSKRSTATEIFGKKIAMPYAISPTASPPAAIATRPWDPTAPFPAWNMPAAW